MYSIDVYCSYYVYTYNEGSVVETKRDILCTLHIII